MAAGSGHASRFGEGKAGIPGELKRIEAGDEVEAEPGFFEVDTNEEPDWTVSLSGDKTTQGQ